MQSIWIRWFTSEKHSYMEKFGHFPQYNLRVLWSLRWIWTFLRFYLPLQQINLASLLSWSVRCLGLLKMVRIDWKYCVFVVVVEKKPLPSCSCTSAGSASQPEWFIFLVVFREKLGPTFRKQDKLIYNMIVTPPVVPPASKIRGVKPPLVETPSSSCKEKMIIYKINIQVLS